MAGVRIRWRGVARVAAIVLVALVALRLLPGLLRAPEPPPLAGDVGLPKAAHRAAAVPDAPTHRRQVTKRRHKPSIEKPRKHPVKRKRKPHPVPEKVVESPPPPPPEYAPPAAPEPVAEPLPEPAPEPVSTPGDGSQEFAPH
jgi:hypothetical protein